LAPWRAKVNPFREFRTRALLVGLPLAGLRFAVPASDNAGALALPKDPCALLKPAEIQAALTPGTAIGSGVASDNMLPLGVECAYTWGPRTPEWGQSALTITIIDATKAWPGRSPEEIEEGVLAKVQVGGPDASRIPGVGDAAAFTLETRSSNATAEAISKRRPCICRSHSMKGTRCRRRTRSSRC
jgi:hypothetical protein